MKFSRHLPARLLGSLLVTMLITLACAPGAAADGPTGSPEQTVRRAWEAARDAGAYRFASDVVQTTRPAPALSNVGRSITRDELHLEGSVDLPARSLEMRLWTDGGSVANPATAAEMRIQGEAAWTRQPGGSWQQVEDFTGGFAPNGDFLSYLAGIKNVKRDDVMRDDMSGQDADSSFSSQASRFTFDFDGPAFADYMRDQLEQYLREKGELPAGLYLDSSRTYQEMIGQGEVTLDDARPDGSSLPQSLSIHLVYPPDDNNQRAEADITISFVFAQAEATQASHRSSASVGLGGLLGTLTAWHNGARTVLPQQTLLLTLLILCCLTIIVARRSPRTYRVVAWIVIASMVVIPALQAQQAFAFSERQAASGKALRRHRRAKPTSATTRQRTPPCGRRSSAHGIPTGTHLLR